MWDVFANQSENFDSFATHSLLSLLAVHMTNNWWRFRKILEPSQNIWTLSHKEASCLKVSFLVMSALKNFQNTIFLLVDRQEKNF